MTSARLGSEKYQFYKSLLTRMGLALSTFRTGSLGSTCSPTGSGKRVERGGRYNELALNGVLLSGVYIRICNILYSTYRIREYKINALFPLVTPLCLDGWGSIYLAISLVTNVCTYASVLFDREIISNCIKVIWLIN